MGKSLKRNLAVPMSCVIYTDVPSLIANYVYDLVKEYNQFYHDYSILREENAEVRAFRLMLSANVAKVIKTGMGLLGIEVPDRM
jgi:arginyl-tRNA synthetase